MCLLWTKHKFEGTLPKGPYLPCVNMAGKAVLAGYHRIVHCQIIYYIKALHCLFYHKVLITALSPVFRSI